MSETVHGIAVYLLILNILLPGFVYGFVGFSASGPGEVDLIDEDSLVLSGIYIDPIEKRSLTYGTYTEFDNSSKVWRVRWYKPSLGQANWRFYVETIPSDWVFQLETPVIIGGELHSATENTYITNATIISSWEGGPGEASNWTRVSLRDLGLEAFITCEKYNHNITEAVLNQGEVNITVGEPINFNDFTGENFMNWYWGLVSGSENYGLPAFVQWLFQIQAILLIFSAVIIARDLLPIP